MQTSIDGENATRLQVFKSFMHASRTSFNSTANDDYELKSYNEKPNADGEVPIEKSIVSGLLNLLPASDDKVVAPRSCDIVPNYIYIHNYFSSSVF